MQNNQITIADRDLNDSIVFLAKYGNSFWSYIRGEGTAILLASGAILLIIAGAASTSDPHLHKPVWVYICFALVVFSGAWIVTFFVYQFKKTNAMRIVSQTVSAALPVGQNRSLNDDPISIYVLPPQPAHIATHG
ncbi:MAG: hypothetical protein JOS17DRAFT_792789 [Linnemannia elongata]|nr:MAG: hypothetical protein JOS17DRAFT_792789 [Linnemannia elongata]